MIGVIMNGEVVYIDCNKIQQQFTNNNFFLFFILIGLMIDVARHYIPLSILKRSITGMAIAKLNVLHLHLSDSQVIKYLL